MEGPKGSVDGYDEELFKGDFVALRRASKE